MKTNLLSLAALLFILFISGMVYSQSSSDENNTSDDTFEQVKETVKSSTEDVRDNPLQPLKDAIQKNFIDPINSKSDSKTEDNNSNSNSDSDNKKTSSDGN